jgi:hypothetical protein
MVGVDLAFDSVAVVEGLAVQMLIAVPVAERLHGGHPKVVGEGADQAHRLFEAVLDLEAQAVEANDLDGVQGSVGAHQQAGAAGRVEHGHEAHEPTGGAPQQVANPIAHDDVVLTVDRALGLLQAPGILEQGSELDLVALESGTTSFPSLRRFVSLVSDRVGLHPGNQVMVLLEQAVDDLARGIVAVGDKVDEFGDGDDAEQGEHLVEQGTPIPVGPHEPLVNARGQGDGRDAGGSLDQQAHRLQRMSHDGLGLGVGVRLLMQQLHRRHIPAPFGDLDAVAHQYQPTFRAQRCGE